MTDPETDPGSIAADPDRSLVTELKVDDAAFVVRAPKAVGDTLHDWIRETVVGGGPTGEWVQYLDSGYTATVAASDSDYLVVLVEHASMDVWAACDDGAHPSDPPLLAQVALANTDAVVGVLDLSVTEFYQTERYD